MENKINDTSESAERILIEGYRDMPFHKKLAQVSALTQMVQKMALSRIRSQYGEISEKECKECTSCVSIKYLPYIPLKLPS